MATKSKSGSNCLRRSIPLPESSVRHIASPKPGAKGSKLNFHQLHDSCSGRQTRSLLRCLAPGRGRDGRSVEKNCGIVPQEPAAPNAPVPLIPPSASATGHSSPPASARSSSHAASAFPGATWTGCYGRVEGGLGKLRAASRRFPRRGNSGTPHRVQYRRQQIPPHRPRQLPQPQGIHPGHHEAFRIQQGSMEIR